MMIKRIQVDKQAYDQLLQKDFKPSPINATTYAIAAFIETAKVESVVKEFNIAHIKPKQSKSFCKELMLAVIFNVLYFIAKLWQAIHQKSHTVVQLTYTKESDIKAQSHTVDKRCTIVPLEDLNTKAVDKLRKTPALEALEAADYSEELLAAAPLEPYDGQYRYAVVYLCHAFTDAQVKRIEAAAGSFPTEVEAFKAKIKKGKALAEEQAVTLNGQPLPEDLQTFIRDNLIFEWIGNSAACAEENPQAVSELLAGNQNIAETIKTLIQLDSKHIFKELVERYPTTGNQYKERINRAIDTADPYIFDLVQEIFAQAGCKLKAYPLTIDTARGHSVLWRTKLETACVASMAQRYKVTKSSNINQALDNLLSQASQACHNKIALAPNVYDKLQQVQHILAADRIILEHFDADLMERYTDHELAKFHEQLKMLIAGAYYDVSDAEYILSLNRQLDALLKLPHVPSLKAYLTRESLREVFPLGEYQREQALIAGFKQVFPSRLKSRSDGTEPISGSSQKQPSSDAKQQTFSVEQLQTDLEDTKLAEGRRYPVCVSGSENFRSFAAWVAEQYIQHKNILQNLEITVEIPERDLLDTIEYTTALPAALIPRIRFNTLRDIAEAQPGAPEPVADREHPEPALETQATEKTPDPKHRLLESLEQEFFSEETILEKLPKLVASLRELVKHDQQQQPLLEKTEKVFQAFSGKETLTLEDEALYGEIAPSLYRLVDELYESHQTSM